MRNPKGTVSLESHRGMLRLHLPRHLYEGQQKYLYLGLADTAVNRQAAMAKKYVIEADIAFDRFDETLTKYTSKAKDDLPTLDELWAKYEAYKATILAESTMIRDFPRVRNHISRLPSTKLKNARQIRNYLIKELTPASAKRVLLYLSACCKWAVEEELITNNPFENMPVVKVKKADSINPFTKAERDEIIAAFEKHEYYSFYTPFVKFLFFTGARTSEAVALQWKHISGDMKVITFSEAVVYGKRKGTKTGKIRRFPVNKQLREVLLEVQMKFPATPESLVFPSPTGITIDSHNFLNRAWSTVIKSLPIHYRKQYCTRHTFITLCLESGVKVKQVAEWVGNSPHMIWQHYAGLVSECDVPEL